MTDKPPEKTKRVYNSPARRLQAQQTRQKIIAAGVSLVKQLPRWDWRNISFREISQLAGVSERTLYRYFNNESKLRDAIIASLVQDTGINLEQLSIDNFDTAVAQMFYGLANFAARSEEVPDPKFKTIANERHQAVLSAVKAHTGHWPDHQQMALAGLLDTLWSPATYERLALVWQQDPQQAIDSVQWLCKLIFSAIERGDSPLPNPR